MRRLIAGLTCVAAATLVAPVTATSAHAKPAPANPLTALRKQFVSNHGVKYKSSTKIGKFPFTVSSGKFQFGRSGVVASDLLTAVLVSADDLDEELKGLALPERTVKVKTTAYIRGGLLSTQIPQGRPWVSLPGGPATGLLGIYGQLVNVTEPATLKTLLAAARSKRPGGVVAGAETTAYSGTVTFGSLYRVSPWFRGALLVKPKATILRTKLTWKLYIGADGLTRRVVTSFPASALGLGRVKLNSDSRFTAWGAKVGIKPPSDDQVVEIGDTEAEAVPPVFNAN